jgi:hypothetical protein
VAALVAHKPLDTWQDSDVKAFETQISDLGRRFKLVEQVAVVRQTLPPATPVLRVGVADTQRERSVVVHTNGQTTGDSLISAKILKSLEADGILSREQQIFALANALRELLGESADESASL